MVMLVGTVFDTTSGSLRAVFDTVNSSLRAAFDTISSKLRAVFDTINSSLGVVFDTISGSYVRSLTPSGRPVEQPATDEGAPSTGASRSHEEILRQEGAHKAVRAGRQARESSITCKHKHLKLKENA